MSSANQYGMVCVYDMTRYFVCGTLVSRNGRQSSVGSLLVIGGIHARGGHVTGGNYCCFHVDGTVR